MPVTNGDGGIEKLCGESRFSLAVSVPAAMIILLRAMLGVTRVNAAKHKVARGGCFK